MEDDFDKFNQSTCKYSLEQSKPIVAQGFQKYANLLRAAGVDEQDVQRQVDMMRNLKKTEPQWDQSAQTVELAGDVVMSIIDSTQRFQALGSPNILEQGVSSTIPEAVDPIQ